MLSCSLELVLGLHDLFVDRSWHHPLVYLYPAYVPMVVACHHEHRRHSAVCAVHPRAMQVHRHHFAANRPKCQTVYIIAYIVYAIGIRFSLFNIAMIVQLMSVVTLFVMTWVIAMFNACFLALNNQYRIYPEYGTPSLTDGKKRK